MLAIAHLSGSKNEAHEGCEGWQDTYVDEFLASQSIMSNWNKAAVVIAVRASGPLDWLVGGSESRNAALDHAPSRSPAAEFAESWKMQHHY